MELEKNMFTNHKTKKIVCFIHHNFVKRGNYQETQKHFKVCQMSKSHHFHFNNLFYSSTKELCYSTIQSQ